MSDPFGVLSDADRALLKPAPRPDKVDGDEGGPDRRPLLRRRLDLRAQAGRDPLPGVEGRVAGLAALAQRPEPQRALPGGRRRRSRTTRRPTSCSTARSSPSPGSQTSFARLQQRGERPVSIFFYVFDLLHLAGHDTTALPLRARKSLLRHALAWHGPLRLSSHRNRDGEAYFREACEKGWEGLIAKRADSPYTHGRSRDWLKLKCSAEQELVIGGFTAPRGSRTDLGALLLGHFEDGRLRYAGKVGTGFTQATLRDLAARLAPIARDGSPFADEVRERHVTWVEPELVAQIGFSEWTRDGRLRHPRFLGLRDDKAATEVVRERDLGRDARLRLLERVRGAPRRAAPTPPSARRPAR